MFSNCLFQLSAKFYALVDYRLPWSLTLLVAIGSYEIFRSFQCIIFVITMKIDHFPTSVDHAHVITMEIDHFPTPVDHAHVITMKTDHFPTPVDHAHVITLEIDHFPHLLTMFM